MSKKNVMPCGFCENCDKGKVCRDPSVQKFVEKRIKPIGQILDMKLEDMTTFEIEAMFYR